jgi:hypothetical protein
MYFYALNNICIGWNKRFSTIQNTMPKEHGEVSKGTKYFSQLSKSKFTMPNYTQTGLGTFYPK